MQKIIIISVTEDAHIPFVTPHLTLPTIILDPVEFLKEDRLSYRLSGGKFEVLYNNQVLDDIVGVWYRKPASAAKLDPPVHENEKDYSRSAIHFHFSALRAVFPEATWISDYYAIERASHKPAQLALASEIGFNVPETLITSDSKLARLFVSARQSSIIKPLAVYFPTGDPGTMRMFWAKKVSSEQEIDYTNLHLAPAIFQQAIDHDFDVRVTVVGDKVFAAAIRVKGLDSNSQVRDWRIGAVKGKMSIQAYRLPEAIAKKCVLFVKRSGLKFGAIDLIMDKSGKIWFLENNSNGQWAFVEEQTGQPIGKAIAELLVYGKN